MKVIAKKGIYIGLFIAILALGVFLRGYNFSNWLHFELDQARDAKVIDLAVEKSIGNLPLLGPKAAGTFLRLGPAFYYMEYISAKIFGNSPASIAYSTLLFSVLTLPLFYFFCRRYFSKNISLGLLFIFSISLFMVVYSRFAWNPNNLPFFMLLSFYALLRVVDKEEKRKNIWMIIFAVAFAIVTQLHFLALAAVSVTSLVFLIIKKPKLKIRTWLAALFIVLVFYSPVIINDIKTEGDNVKEFIRAVSGKSEDKEHALVEKTIRNWTEHSLGHFLILSGSGEAKLFKVIQTGATMDVRCDNKCQENLLLGIVSLALFSFGILLLFVNLFKEKDVLKKDFLLISALWFLISFIILIPLSYDFSARFFLITAPLAFIWLGLIIKFLINRVKNKAGKLMILTVITLTLIGTNGIFINERYNELKNAPVEYAETRSDKILKEKARVTLEQQYLIIDHIKNIYDQNKYPVYINSESYYRRAFLYHLEKMEIPRDDFRNASNSKNVYREGNYFLIYRTSTNYQEEVGDYLDNYSLISEKEFGTLKLFQLIPKEIAITTSRQEFGPVKKARSAMGVPVRCRWNEIFKECNPDEAIDENDE